MFTLAELLSIYGKPATKDAAAEGVSFGGVAVDSRSCRPGDLFVALPGERRDGHDFIAAALASGCRGAMARSGKLVAAQCDVLCARTYEWSGVGWRVEGPADAPTILVLVPDTLAALQRLAAWWRSRFSPQVIGVTGSVGKSSTKELLAAILAMHMPILKSERSYNNEIGLPLTLLALREEHRAVIVEMGTYGPGEIALLAEIARPQIGVVTNVSHSHLERMGSLETIARCKAELPAALPRDGLAVLNGDEPLVRAMATVTPASVCLYGLGPECHLRGSQVQSHGLAGFSFRVQEGSEAHSLHCALPGRHNVYNALAAIAVARHLGLSWEEIAAGLENPQAHLRLVPLPAVGGATLLDDTYNASPYSCRAALDLLAELSGRKVAVLGDMYELGTFEEEGHRRVGRWAAAVVEELHTLGPRARWIAEEAVASGMPAERVHPATTHEEVIQALRGRLRPGDVVLVKGSRAMEMERIVEALRREER